MKAILIVFLSFHYSGGAASSTVEFDNMRQCMAAKAAIEQEHAVKPKDGWGHRRLFVVCVENK